MVGLLERLAWLVNKLIGSAENPKENSILIQKVGANLFSATVETYYTPNGCWQTLEPMNEEALVSKLAELGLHRRDAYDFVGFAKVRGRYEYSFRTPPALKVQDVE